MSFLEFKRVGDGVIGDHELQDETENISDDFVVIGESFYKKLWKFPMVNVCPNQICFAKFTSRSAAMTHYQEVHAKSAILCEICYKPIASQNKSHFVSHYRVAHPGDLLPPFISECVIYSTSESSTEDEAFCRPERKRKRSIEMGRQFAQSKSHPCIKKQRADQVIFMRGKAKQTNVQTPPNIDIFENDVLKIIVDVREYSGFQVKVKDNCVIIDGTRSATDEYATMKKNFAYRFDIKRRFNSSDVKSTLSSDKMLSVIVKLQKC